MTTTRHCLREKQKLDIAKRIATHPDLFEKLNVDIFRQRIADIIGDTPVTDQTLQRIAKRCGLDLDRKPIEKARNITAKRNRKILALGLWDVYRACGVDIPIEVVDAIKSVSERSFEQLCDRPVLKRHVMPHQMTFPFIGEDTELEPVAL